MTFLTSYAFYYLLSLTCCKQRKKFLEVYAQGPVTQPNNPKRKSWRLKFITCLRRLEFGKWEEDSETAAAGSFYCWCCFKLSNSANPTPTRFFFFTFFLQFCSSFSQFNCFICFCFLCRQQFNIHTSHPSLIPHISLLLPIHFLIT